MSNAAERFNWAIPPILPQLSSQDQAFLTGAVHQRRGAVVPQWCRVSAPLLRGGAAVMPRQRPSRGGAASAPYPRWCRVSAPLLCGGAAVVPISALPRGGDRGARLQHRPTNRPTRGGSSHSRQLVQDV